MRHIFSCTIIAPLLTLSLSCCASQYGSQRTIVRYYPSCYRPIYDLRRSEHNVARVTAGTALVGALLGAALGVAGSDRRHRGQGTLAGAALGGVAGGMAGNIYAQKQQIADENRRMASYLETLEGDISNLDIVSGSARASLQCYDRQFAGLLEDIRIRRVPPAQARQMYSEIRSGREEAIALLGQAETHGHELDRQYQQAFYEEERQLGLPHGREEELASAPRQSQLNRSTPKQSRRTDTGPRTHAQRTLANAKKKQAALSQKVNRITEDRVAAQRRNQAEARELERMLADIDA